MICGLVCLPGRLWLGAALFALTAQAIAADPAASLQASATQVLQRSQQLAVRPERAALQAIARAGGRLVAVGEHGVVALSDDGGRQWRAGLSGTDVTLTSVRFFDEKVGWATGHMGVVLKTTDGGLHWTRQLDGRAIGQLALAQAASAPASKRADAQAAAQRLVDEGLDKPLLTLLVQSASQLTVYGAFNIALQSQDGGGSWQFLDLAGNPSSYHLYGAARAGASVVVAGERGLLMKADGPAGPYAPLKSPFEGSFFGVLAIAPDRLLAYGLAGNAYVSEDAGASWSRSGVGGDTATFNDAVLLRGGRVAMCDQGGRVLLSNDAGREFKLLPSGGAPATGIAETDDGALVLSTLAGVVRIPLPTAVAMLSRSVVP